VYWPNPETCAAFLANYDPQLQVTVTYDGLSYDLPPLSISILPDCRTEVYNTAKVILVFNLSPSYPIGHMIRVIGTYSAKLRFRRGLVQCMDVISVGPRK